MSDLLYYITAVTKGKKPKVVFFGDELWTYNTENARLVKLQEAKSLAKHQPTHCIFVEASNSLIEILDSRANDFNILTSKEFYKIVEELGCKTVSTRKKKKSKIEIAQQEEKREYILYMYREDGDVIYYYHCSGAHTTIAEEFGKTKGYVANAYTKQEGNEKMEELLYNSGEKWILGLAEDFRPKPPTIENKKQIGYVLYDDKKASRKVYKNQTILTATFGNNSGDVYRTKEEADFIAYVLNNSNSIDKYYTWQVEQIEF